MSVNNLIKEQEQKLMNAKSKFSEIQINAKKAHASKNLQETHRLIRQLKKLEKEISDEIPKKIEFYHSLKRRLNSSRGGMKTRKNKRK